MPGKGRMAITGNLKEVMKESISAANSYVKSRATHFGIKPPLFDKTDVHVHVPEGATPKDGPSAGVAMAVAMVSVLTGIPIRKDIAMTGEITLRGRVLGIGGLKEKLLAALRSGIKTVLIPQDNEKDLAEVPDTVKAALEIIPVSTVDQVLALALTGPLTPVEWNEDDEPILATPAGASDLDSSLGGSARIHCAKGNLVSVANGVVFRGQFPGKEFVVVDFDGAVWLDKERAKPIV